MNIGDKCPYKAGFVVREVSGKCPKHGCDIFIARKDHKYLTFCVECRKQGRKRYHKDSYRRQAWTRVDDHNYIASADSEGLDAAYMGWLWNAKADAKIEEFWRVRGMTDKDAIKKFRGAWKTHVEHVSELSCNRQALRPNFRSTGRETGYFG